MNINKNEQLFWKVIHNKYIFNLIFEKIHEISNEIEQAHSIKSYKFKDIKSVSWMILYGLFNLLNYKLLNNESIEISVNCIKNILIFLITKQFENQLLKIATIRTIEKEKLKSNQHHEVKSNKPTKMYFYEIIALLLKNYRSSIYMYDLIIIIFEYSLIYSNHQKDSLKLIKKLVGEPYSIVLTPDHFKLVILNFNLDFIKEFIEIANQFNCTIVDQDFKDQSLSIVLNKKNSSIDQQVLKFILDNPQYYSQSYDPMYTPEEIPWSYCGGVICSNRLDRRTKHDIGKRDIRTFFNLDQNLQIKLLSLKYYNTYEWLYYERELGHMNEDKSQLRKKRDDANQFIYDINYNSDHLDPISKIIAIKDFFKDYIVY